MKIYNIDNHSSCFNYKNTGHSLLEIMTIENKSQATIQVNQNKIILVIIGNIKFDINDCTSLRCKRGDMIFLINGESCKYTVLKSCKLMFIKVNYSIRFCDTYKLEHLFEEKSNPDNLSLQQIDVYKLQMKKELWIIISGLLTYIDDGIKCTPLYDLKIREFFYIMWIYYDKVELQLFFYRILSIDIAFYGTVTTNYYKYKTIKEFAKDLSYTPKTFSRKFKTVFGKTAYQWMKERKSQSILKEIISSEKLFKQIAYENNFKSQQHFNNYCRIEFGQSPYKIRKDHRKTTLK